MNRLSELTAKRIIEALKNGNKYKLDSKISNFGYDTSRIEYTFQVHDRQMIILYRQLDSYQELQIKLKKDGMHEIIVFHYHSHKDSTDKSNWIHEGIWEEITQKFVEDVEEKFGELLREFEKAFRLPAVTSGNL